MNVIEERAEALDLCGYPLCASKIKTPPDHPVYRFQNGHLEDCRDTLVRKQVLNKRSFDWPCPFSLCVVPPVCTAVFPNIVRLLQLFCSPFCRAASSHYAMQLSELPIGPMIFRPPVPISLFSMRDSA
jgi:hypothetical protein